MAQLTENYSIKFSKSQIETLRKLKTYKINVNQFIRIAIAEKIKRDYKVIKEKKEYCPF